MWRGKECYKPAMSHDNAAPPHTCPLPTNQFHCIVQWIVLVRSTTHVPWERSLVHTMSVPIRKSVVPSLVLAADCVAKVVFPVLPFSSHPTWTCFLPSSLMPSPSIPSLNTLSTLPTLSPPPFLLLPHFFPSPPSLLPLPQR